MFEISKICRTCLGLDGILLSIYDSKDSNSSSCVADMLSNFTNVKAEKSDGMPEKVCLACISEINRCFSFKIKCDNADKTLRQLLDIADDPQCVDLQKFDNEEDVKTLAEHVPFAKAPDEKNLQKQKSHERLSKDREIREASSTSTVDTNLILPFRTAQVIETSSCFDVDSDKNEFTTIEEHKIQEILEHDKNSGDYNMIFTKYMDEKQEVESDMIFEEEAFELEAPNYSSVESPSKDKKSESKCSMCPMSFVHARNLTKHIAKIHNASVSTTVKQHSQNHAKSCSVVLFKNNNAEHEKNLQLDSFVEEIDLRDDEDYDLHTIEEIEEGIEVQESQLVKNDTEIKGNKLSCPRCKALFAMKSSLNIHIKLNKCTKPQFSCTDCQKVFVSLDALNKHIKTHKYTCKTCAENFDCKEDLDKHNAIHKGVNLKYQCSYCKKVFSMRSTLKDHMRVHTGEKPFVCDLCGKAFSQNANLKQHVMRHNKTKPHQCDQCNRSFVSKGELYAHLRSHSGDHPFRCDTCSSAFTTSSSLVKHKRIHTGERPYACDLCPMRFTALNTLKNHRRTHTGEKPYKCKFCPRAFAQKSDCSIHMQTHTGERKHRCHICNARFHQSGTLRTHMKTHKSSMKQLPHKRIDEERIKEPYIDFHIVEIEGDQEIREVQQKGQEQKRDSIDSEEIEEITEDEILHFNIEECPSSNSVFGGD